MAILQKLIVIAGTSGTIRARIEEILMARRPVLRTNMRRDFNGLS